MLCRAPQSLPSRGAAHVNLAFQAACCTIGGRPALRHGSERKPPLCRAAHAVKHSLCLQLMDCPAELSRLHSSPLNHKLGALKRELGPPTNLLLLFLCDAQTARAAVVESVPLQLDRLVHDQAQVSCSSEIS